MDNQHTIGYLDCFSGISGDMFLGAMIDAGLDEQYLRTELEKLHLDDLSFTVNRVKRQSIAAVKLEVDTKPRQEIRTLSTICKILEQSSLEDDIIAKAIEIFIILAKAEARVHDTDIEKIHFHEIGALDTIVDIVGTIIGLKTLKIESLICSPLPFSRGFVTCAHGKLPLTAPAVCNILESVPLYGVNINQEVITPTGAALVKGLADGYGDLPAMTIKRVGYGAADKMLPDDQPNLLRCILGEAVIKKEAQEVQVIETNLDDWAPEGFQFLCERLLKNKALDVSLAPIQMKKGRPGYLLQIICKKAHQQKLSDIVLSETTSIGLRYRTERRITLPRTIITVTTRYGELQAKEVVTPVGTSIYPEYETCLKAAKKHNVPLQQIYRAVIQGEKK